MSCACLAPAAWRWSPLELGLRRRRRIAIRAASATPPSVAAPPRGSRVSRTWRNVEATTKRFVEDVSEWGIGVEPIFTIVVSSDGQLRVEIDEEEISGRCNLQSMVFRKKVDVAERIAKAKQLAADIEKGVFHPPPTSALFAFVKDGHQRQLQQQSSIPAFLLRSGPFMSKGILLGFGMALVSYLVLLVRSRQQRRDPIEESPPSTRPENVHNTERLLKIRSMAREVEDEGGKVGEAEEVAEPLQFAAVVRAKLARKKTEEASRNAFPDTAISSMVQQLDDVRRLDEPKTRSTMVLDEVLGLLATSGHEIHLDNRAVKENKNSAIDIEDVAQSVEDHPISGAVKTPTMEDRVEFPESMKADKEKQQGTNDNGFTVPAVDGSSRVMPRIIVSTKEAAELLSERRKKISQKCEASEAKRETEQTLPQPQDQEGSKQETTLLLQQQQDVEDSKREQQAVPALEQEDPKKEQLKDEQEAPAIVHQEEQEAPAIVEQDEQLEKEYRKTTDVLEYDDSKGRQLKEDMAVMFEQQLQEKLQKEQLEQEQDKSQPEKAEPEASPISKEQAVKQEELENVRESLKQDCEPLHAARPPSPWSEVQARATLKEQQAEQKQGELLKNFASASVQGTSKTGQVPPSSDEIGTSAKGRRSNRGKSSKKKSERRTTSSESSRKKREPQKSKSEGEEHAKENPNHVAAISAVNNFLSKERKLDPEDRTKESRAVTACSADLSPLPTQPKNSKKVWPKDLQRRYDRETDPEVRALMREVGQDLDEWISEEKVEETLSLFFKGPDGQRELLRRWHEEIKNEAKKKGEDLGDYDEQEAERIFKRYGKIEERMKTWTDRFGPQALVNKYKDYKPPKPDYLWWFGLRYVACVGVRNEEKMEAPGLYSMDLAEEGKNQPGRIHVIGFEDQFDADHFCQILVPELDELGGETGAAVVPFEPKELFREANAAGYKVTVIRKGELKMVAGQPLYEVEHKIRLIGRDYYVQEEMRGKSIDVKAVMEDLGRGL